MDAPRQPRQQRDWVPALTLAFMFVIQTGVVVWKAAELSANQSHIQKDISDLHTDITILKDRDQKIAEIYVHVTELQRRVARIENDPMQ